MVYFILIAGFLTNQKEFHTVWFTVCVFVSDRWAGQTVRLWPRGSAVCSLKFPRAQTFCRCRASFTRPYGRWDGRRRGASVRSSSARTKPPSVCPPPAIKSCPPQPRPNWWRWSLQELRVNAEHPHWRFSRASRSSDTAAIFWSTWGNTYWRKRPQKGVLQGMKILFK